VGNCFAQAAWANRGELWRQMLCRARVFIFSVVAIMESAEAMASHIRERFGWQIEVPQYGERFQLD